MNTVNLIGRVVRDAEVKAVGEAKVAVFTLAVDRGRKDKDGNAFVDFIPCQAWNGRADFAQKHAKKGQQFGITGRLETYTYEKEGQKRSGFNINISDFTFCGTKSSASPETFVPMDLDAESAELPFA